MCFHAAGYMKTALKIPEEDIQKVCLEYYTNYGTTMAGLVVSKSQASTSSVWTFCCFIVLSLLHTGYQEAMCNTQDLSCTGMVLQALDCKHCESFDTAS